MSRNGKKKPPYVRILLLADQIHKEQSWSKISYKLEQLNNYLIETKSLNLSVGTSFLMNGGKETEPLDKIFDSGAPQSTKDILAQVLASIFVTLKGNRAGFFQWLLQRLNQKNPESQCWMLRVLILVLGFHEKVENNYVSASVMRDILIPGLLDYIDSIDFVVPELFKCFSLIENQYPEQLVPYFTRLVGLLIRSALQDPQNSSSNQTVEFIKSSNLWANHINYGCELLLEFNHQLEELFDIKCKPHSATFKPLVDLKEIPPVAFRTQTLFSKISMTLAETLYTNSKMQLEPLSLSNPTLNQQLQHALLWNSEIGMMVGVHTANDGWLQISTFN